MNMSALNSGAVVLRGVGKRYGAVVAVRPVDLHVEAGSLVTLLGPSGCGKTTLLRLIAGLERVSEGTIAIGGRDVTNLSAGERNVSMVFQSYALFPHMTVGENVAYGLISSGAGRVDAQAQAAQALETVGLKSLGDRLPSQISGGQQQRVALARALVLKPAVLLFDEPLSNLDARLRRSMREEIRHLQQHLGLTAIYVTHDQSEALAVSDRIVVMRNAEIAQEGTPRQLYDAPKTVFVATFMGEANHVRGTLVSERNGKGEFRLGTLTVNLSNPGLVPGEVDIVIRPEALVLLPPGTENCMAATVASMTYMGGHTEYSLDTAIGRLFAIAPRGQPVYMAGQQAGIRLADHGVFAVCP